MGVRQLKSIGLLLLLPVLALAQQPEPLPAATSQAADDALSGTASRSAASQPNPISVALTSEVLDLTPHIAVFEDTEAALSIDEISSASYAEQFSAVDGSPNYGFSSSAWWVRVTFANDSQIDQALLLRESYPLLDHLDLWYRDPQQAGGWVHRQTGDRLPFATRDIAHKDYIFPVVLPAGAQVDFYFRYFTRGSVNISLTASQQTPMLASISRQQLAFGIYYGGFVVLVLYNLLMWLTVKDKAFLYYLLYVASYGIYFAVNNGFAFQYFWPDMPWWANQSLVVMLTLSLFFGMHFTRVFLRLSENAPRLDTISIYLQGVIAVVLVVGSFLPYRSIIVPLSGLTVIVVSQIILCGTVTLLKGYRPARYFMLAWGALLLGVMAYMLKTFGLLPHNVVTEHGQQIGSLIEMVLLSLGLASRVDSLQRQSLTDPLTSLANRRFFDEKLLAEFERAGGQGQALALLMVDIDHFKNFNDRFGHAWGDEALKMVGAVLQDNARPQDHVCRYGGEEFAIIMPGADRAAASEIAEHLRTSVSDADMRGERLSVSIGVVSMQDDRFTTAAAFFDAADRALYQAKSDGRNCVVVFSPTLAKRYGRRATDLLPVRS